MAHELTADFDLGAATYHPPVRGKKSTAPAFVTVKLTHTDSQPARIFDFLEHAGGEILRVVISTDVEDHGFDPDDHEEEGDGTLTWAGYGYLGPASLTPPGRAREKERGEVGQGVVSTTLKIPANDENDLVELLAFRVELAAADASRAALALEPYQGSLFDSEDGEGADSAAGPSMFDEGDEDDGGGDD